MCSTRGCHQPSWNRQPGEYCSRQCRDGEPRDVQWSRVEFVTGLSMYPLIMESLGGIKKSIDIFAYVIDHTAVCNLIMQKLLKEKAKGRLLLDKNNFLTSSCARQAERVKELSEAGCEVRSLRPKRVGFAIMHVKTFIVDNREMFLGSVNLTHNGLENNKEHLVKISESAIVDKVANDFQETWEMAEEVAPEMILEMIERDQKRKLKRHERQVQDREKPMSRNRRSGRRSSSESVDDEASETLL